MNDANPKQQIVDRIKNVTNILVTVSKNPSVDELSAAIGLTLMLNKLNKHATAVFSGQVPAAITFLEPDKTLENTVDSLRDFIIALDKEKADRLRYRVEDDVVRIFITPYRTKISESDLEFTHGDFNVELVLALGVENQDDLDEAIVAHGKILHDATVATLSSQSQKSDLGSIDWQDAQASSLSEMLVAISESIKGKEPLLDEQIATALLTGIVSATDRFSNSQTSPKAMTMAAQLMAAGANQQLIAARLEETEDISPIQEEKPKTEGELVEDSSEKIRGADEQKEEEESAPSSQDLGEMTVSHDDSQPEETPSDSSSQNDQVSAEIENEDEQPAVLDYVESASIEEHDRRAKKQASEEALDEALNKLSSVAPPQGLAQELEAATEEERTLGNSNETDNKVVEPSIGGTFSATAEEAAEEKRREEESNRNKIIMNHGGQVQVPEDHSQADSVLPKAPDLQPLSPDLSPHQTLADIEEQVRNEASTTLPDVDHADTARQEINSLFGDVSTSPQPSTVLTPDPLLPPPPPLPDFSTLPPLPGANPSEPLQPNVTTLDESQTPPIPPAPDQFRIPGA